MASVLVLSGCSHENDRDARAVAIPSADGAVTVTWTYGEGDLVYAHGFVPGFVLTTQDGVVQTPERTGNDTWSWGSIPQGTYTFRAGLHPCDDPTDCEPVGDSDDACSDELLVDGDVAVQVVLTPGEPCSLTSTPASASGASASAPASYSYLLHSYCGHRALIGTYAVVERHGVVESVEVVPPRGSRYSPKPADFPTLMDLLAKAEGARPKAEVSMEVDEDGLPVLVAIDHYPNAIDDEECYEVSDLVELDHTQPPLGSHSEWAETERRVVLTVGHCFVEPIQVAGRTWVTKRAYLGYGALPRRFTRQGTFAVLDDSQATFIADGGAEVAFKVAPKPLPTRGCR